MPMKLVILSMLTNMLSTHQADCNQVTGKKSLIINYMVAQFSCCCYWSSLGKIKSCLEREKLSLLRNALINGDGNWLAPEICYPHSDYGICIAELFVEDYNDKFQTQSLPRNGAHHQNSLAECVQFKLLCTWFMFLCIGAIMVLIILHFWAFLCNMMLGFRTVFPTVSLVLHQLNYSPRPRPIIVAFSILMFGDTQSTSLILSYRMEPLLMFGPIAFQFFSCGQCL